LKGTVEGKEGDFFNVTQFPTGAFEVTGVSDEGGKTMLSGNLTLKGVKQNITFPVSVANVGDELTITSDAFTIDRTKWGVNYGSKTVFDNLGDKFISDEIELKINVVAYKKA
jgi:polyisoprenoid-binding protein YceI